MMVKNFFKRAAGLNILVVGDVMIDRYLTGHVDRISPEAPVPVVAQVEREDRLGGAANVALNIQSVGADLVLCGVVGQDTDSSHFFSLLEEAGLPDSGILVSDERTTTVKTRIIADHQHLLRLDKENSNPLSDLESLRFCKIIEDIFEHKRIDAVILQDYNKGVLCHDVIAWILEKCKQVKIPVVVDPKFDNFWLFKGVDLFKPNLREICDALKKNIAIDQSALVEATNEIREKLGNKRTLITLSEHGVYWSEELSSGWLRWR